MSYEINKDSEGRPKLPSIANVIKAIKFAIFLISIVLATIMLPRGIKALFIGFIILFIPIIMLVSVSEYKDWEICGKILKINEYTTIEIASMEIGIIDEHSEWAPIMPKYMAGFPGLISSHMILKNKKKALVFYHPVYTKFLVMHTGSDKYYMISHPGILKLYEELSRLGAQERSFDSNNIEVDL